MLDDYGLKDLLLESKKDDERQFTGEKGSQAHLRQRLKKVSYFRQQCSTYNQIERRMGAGFLFCLPDNIWKEREYRILVFIN
jgi:hypothetical protein